MIIKLKNIGTIITGNTPSKKNAKYYDSNDIYFIKPDTLDDSKITVLNSSNEFISNNARDKARIVGKNAILITCIGSIGKVGIVTEGEYAFNQQINAIMPNELVIPKYLAYCLLFNKDKLIDIANAPVVPIINKSQFGEFEININEDLTVQQKIVNELNIIQEIILKQRQELEKMDDLIKARFVEMFGDPKNNPLNFPIFMLKDTCKVITGNTPSRKIKDYYGDYIEWIKTDNIIPEKKYPTQANEYLSEKGIRFGRTVDKDSVLMACIAGSVSSIGKVCITDRKLAFNQQINAVVPKKYNVLFLYTIFQMPKDYLVEDINMSLKGILSKSKLEEKKFILPPIELQQQFADFVKQVDKSKLAVQQSLEKTQQLFDSLMQEYFG